MNYDECLNCVDSLIWIIFYDKNNNFCELCNFHEPCRNAEEQNENKRFDEIKELLNRKEIVLEESTQKMAQLEQELNEKKTKLEEQEKMLNQKDEKIATMEQQEKER